MIDLKLLNNAIESKGLKKRFVSEKLGMERTTLRNKLIGKSRITGDEISVLKEILNLTSDEVDSIFFAADVTDSNI